MTPVEHMACRVVALVTAHSILVTPDLHAGIDLARAMVSESNEERAAWPLTEAQQILVRLTHEALTTRYQRLEHVASIFA